MSWESIIRGVICDPDELPAAVDELIRYHRENWETYRRNIEGLSRLRQRELAQDGARIWVQANPARRRSTLARLDDEAIALRPCFLCPENLPPEERGLAFGELVALVNPYPILPRHLTLPARSHTPQRLSGRVPLMLDLARALGPEMAVFYNGPRCGATAPDHFHFQACAAAQIPLLDELSGDGRRAVRSFGRRLLAGSDIEPAPVAAFVEETMRRLGVIEPEPPLNLLVRFDGERYRAAIWPRSRQRPERFFAPEERRLSVSPAALEMGGVMVLAEPEHLSRLDHATARAIYEEVSLSEADFSRLAEELGCR
jgi:hypothetical protein